MTYKPYVPANATIFSVTQSYVLWDLKPETKNKRFTDNFFFDGSNILYQVFGFGPARTRQFVPSVLGK